MIEFKNVSKSFGAKIVLHNVNFSIEKSRIFFVIGKSGTGKSVLLKNIVGLLKPEVGSVILDGEEVTKLSEEELFGVRKKCAMVFQSPALLDSMSSFENVALGIRVHFPNISKEDLHSKVRGALKKVGLDEKWGKLKPTSLSFGYQKRIAIARALALEPSYLLFDEPTTGLDPVAQATVNDLIQHLNTELGITCVIVSHDLQCALKIGHQICLLDGGKVAVKATPKEFLSSDYPLARAFVKEALVRSE